MKAAETMERAAVLGAGTMGSGIAQVCAASGLEVGLYDLKTEFLEHARARIEKSLGRLVEKGKLDRKGAEKIVARIHPATSLDAVCRGADLVVEAVPEDLALKSSLWKGVESRVPDEALLATNTSSLSIDSLADSLRRPERFLGLHFFNPVPVMKLLEIVTGHGTHPAAVEIASTLARRLGKEPIVVRNSPGFASSRLGIALAMEAIRMLEEGVAAAEDIDRAMELGYRHPMGPLRLTDLVGLDVRLGIARHLEETLGGRFRPPALPEKMVAEGRLGRKSGAGFYTWKEA
ncbi:MAG: 3-hydroxyacyl-CoA dehydrogenase family protein [Planctomycetota bacterium]